MICPQCGSSIMSDHSIVCSCGYSFVTEQLLDPTVVLNEDDKSNKVLEPTVALDEAIVANQIRSDLDLLDVPGENSKTAKDKRPENGIGTEMIGKCRLEKVLGKGGMGLVYKAHHTTLDIPVAVKIMLPTYSSSEKFVSRFYREAQVAAKINHPNIVRVYDCGYENKFLYIIMEYVDGGDLGNLLNKINFLEPETALEVAIAICSALTAAQKFNVVHRDIKPENIMVTKDGCYKLVDLGLAKQIDIINHKDQSLTMENTCMGSPPYMSPEQAVDAKHCDIRSDIYSLGCTLFHMLTGRPPYNGDNWQEVICNHTSAKVPSVRDINGNIPYKLDRLIFKCMQKKASERYSSAAELLEALQNISPEITTKMDRIKGFTRIGSVLSQPDIKTTVTTRFSNMYHTDTKLITSKCKEVDVALVCSYCGSEHATRSSLKYICTSESCENRICIDCWLRNGIRMCKEHS